MYEKGINDLLLCGLLPGFPRGIKVARLEMLCKSKWYLYQEAAANETGNVDGCFDDAPDKSEASRSTSQGQIIRYFRV
jgi:hypothetical protein